MRDRRDEAEEQRKAKEKAKEKQRKSKGKSKGKAKEKAKEKLNYQRLSLFYTIIIGKFTSHSSLSFVLIRKGQMDLPIMSLTGQVSKIDENRYRGCFDPLKGILQILHYHSRNRNGHILIQKYIEFKWATNSENIASAVLGRCQLNIISIHTLKYKIRITIRVQ